MYFTSSASVQKQAKMASAIFWKAEEGHPSGVVSVSVQVVVRTHTCTHIIIRNALQHLNT